MATNIENNNPSNCLFTIPQDTGSRIYIAVVTLVALSVILSIVAAAIKPACLGYYSFVPITITAPLLVGLAIGGYFLKKTESPPKPVFTKPPKQTPPVDPPLVVDDYTSKKALEAAETGDLTQMRTLYESGKPFDLSQILGSAANHSQAKICAFLLEKGANPRDNKHGNFTPIHRVFVCSNPQKELETLRVFLEHDSSLVSETLGDWKKTPLHIVVTKQLSLKKVQLVIEHGADVNAVDKHGNTPLHAAAMNQVMVPGYQPNIETIEYLMKAGASSVVSNKKGETFASLAQKHHSKWFNRPDIQERLKNCGALNA